MLERFTGFSRLPGGSRLLLPAERTGRYWGFGRAYQGCFASPHPGRHQCRQCVTNLKGYLWTLPICRKSQLCAVSRNVRWDVLSPQYGSFGCIMPANACKFPVNGQHHGPSESPGFQHDQMLSKSNPSSESTYPWTWGDIICAVARAPGQMPLDFIGDMLGFKPPYLACPVWSRASCCDLHLLHTAALYSCNLRPTSCSAGAGLRTWAPSHLLAKIGGLHSTYTGKHHETYVAIRKWQRNLLQRPRIMSPASPEPLLRPILIPLPQPRAVIALVPEPG